MRLLAASYGLADLPAPGAKFPRLTWQHCGLAAAYRPITHSLKENCPKGGKLLFVMSGDCCTLNCARSGVQCVSNDSKDKSGSL